MIENDNKSVKEIMNDVTAMINNSIEDKKEELKEMDYVDENVEVTIKNEFDYSNIIPKIEEISYLIQYLNNIYNEMNILFEEDEIRNEKIKYEFKNYNYKKSFGTKFEILVREKEFTTITHKSFESFIEAVKSGQVKNIKSLEIHMDIDYNKGKFESLKLHENSFKIVFKPYEIYFKRVSNHNEIKMNQIENTINAILLKFQVSDSIFCSK